MQSAASTKGHNWGYYHLKEHRLEVSEDKQGAKNCFSLDYKDIAISNASSAKEVTLEFNQDEENKRGGDFLCELRLFSAQHGGRGGL
jgi:hypothetical protein